MRTGRITTLVAGAVLAAAVVAPMVLAEVNDTIGVVKEGEDSLSNVEVATRLAEVTFAGQVDTVMIGRDDLFADSMASGVLQAEGPLLLMPPGGPVPPRVREELALLDPQRVILLGGVNAISQEVEDELARRYRVERRAGPSRIETAIAIARTDAPEADTAILARAFEGPDGDPSQAYADALAAGGWSAARGWPVLLTQSEVLTGSTRDYLAASGIRTVMVVGGSAAVGEDVTSELATLVGEVERVGGATRFATATEIAEKRGAGSAADAARILLTDGEGEDAWAAGFASAAHSAAFSAPIVLAGDSSLPPETVEWLSGQGGSAFAQATPETTTPPGAEDFPVLTCVTVPALCEQARIALGLPAQVALEGEPPDGSEVVPGTVIDLTLVPEGPERVDVTGACVVTASYTPSGGGFAVAISNDAAPGPCEVTFALQHPNGTVQTVTKTYVILEPPPAPAPEPTPGQAPQSPPPCTFCE